MCPRDRVLVLLRQRSSGHASGCARPYDASLGCTNHGGIRLQARSGPQLDFIQTFNEVDYSVENRPRLLHPNKAGSHLFAPVARYRRFGFSRTKVVMERIASLGCAGYLSDRTGASLYTASCQLLVQLIALAPARGTRREVIRARRFGMFALQILH